MSQKSNVINENLIFSTELSVTVAHLNYGNHMGLDALVLLLQETRMQFLADNEMTETQIEGDVGTLVSTINMDMRQQCYHGDQLLVQIYSPGFKKNSRGFELKYCLFRTGDQCLVASATSKHLFFNQASQSIARAPDRFYRLMNASLRLIQPELVAA